MLPILLLMATFMSAKANSNQILNQLILKNSKGIVSIPKSMLNKAKSLGLKVQANHGKIAIIWGNQNSKKITYETLSSLSELTNNNNIVIGNINKDIVYFSSIINGSTYYWETRKDQISKILDHTFINLKHHIEPKKNFIPVTIKVAKPAKKWPLIKQIMQTKCNNSHWQIKAISKKHMTISAKINNKECLKGLPFIEKNNNESENI